MRLYWFCEDYDIEFEVIETEGTPPNIGTTLYLRNNNNLSLKFEVIGVDRLIRQVAHPFKYSDLYDAGSEKRLEEVFGIAEYQTREILYKFDHISKQIIYNIDCAEIKLKPINKE